jgi:hypothetical protein
VEQFYFIKRFDHRRGPTHTVQLSCRGDQIGLFGEHMKDLANLLRFSLIDDQASSSRIDIVPENRSATGPVPLPACSLDFVARPFPDDLRSNCANESRMFRVKRPSGTLVLNCWVTETKLTPLASRMPMIREKSSSDRLTRHDARRHYCAQCPGEQLFPSN